MRFEILKIIFVISWIIFIVFIGYSSGKFCAKRYHTTNWFVSYFFMPEDKDKGWGVGNTFITQTGSRIFDVRLFEENTTKKENFTWVVVINYQRR